MNNNKHIFDTARYTARAFERDGNYFLWGYPDLQKLLGDVISAMRDVEKSCRGPTQRADSTSEGVGNEYPLVSDVATRPVGQGTPPLIPGFGGDGREALSMQNLRRQPWDRPLKSPRPTPRHTLCTPSPQDLCPPLCITVPNTTQGYQ